MKRVVNLFFGKTGREQMANVLTYVIALVAIWLGIELKWALKSPMPATWNVYSDAANDHLYQSLNPAVPIPTTIVSHRGGSVAGDTSAGPIARLDYSYSQGQRLFELDFSWTSDDDLVIKHDWKDRSAVPSLAQFLQEAPGEHASLWMVCDWLDDHPDAFIITDCKKRSLEGAARIRMRRPELVPQFIPQIYQFKDYDLVQSQGFRNIVLTLYRCLSNESSDRIIGFAKEHDLFALTLPKRRASDSQLVQFCMSERIPIYVHTINQVDQLARYQADGIFGVYSDILTPPQLATVVSDRGEAGQY